MNFIFKIFIIIFFIKKRFDFYDKNPVKPDNQFLELCKFTNYEPISYAQPKYTEEEAMQDFLTLILSNKKLAELFLFDNKSFSKEEYQKTLDSSYEQIEKAKKDLSGMTSTQVSLPFIAQVNTSSYTPV